MNPSQDDTGPLQQKGRQPDTANSQRPTQADSGTKYRVTDALNDVVKSFRINGLSLTVLAVLMLAMLAGMSIIIGLIGIGLMLTIVSVSAAANPLQSVGVIILVGLLIGLISLLINTLFFNAISLAFFAGANGHRSSLSDTLKVGFKRAWRVFLSQVLLFTVIFGPYILLMLLIILIEKLEPSRALAVFYMIGGVAAFVWQIVAFLRYFMVPYVALFEPELRLPDTLGRSKRLVEGGGQWFAVKAYFLFFVLILIVTALFGGLSAPQKTVGHPEAIAGDLVILLFVPFMLGVPVMLYVNRRQARKNNHSL